MATRVIEITDEEAEYLEFCMALGTTIVAGLPIADLFVERVITGINNGSHRRLSEKINPERAAQVAEMTVRHQASGETLDELKQRVGDTITQAQAASRGKHAN